MVKLRHCLIHDITERLESFSLNTVVSGFMEYNNKMIDMAKKTGGIDKETLSTYSNSAGSVRSAHCRRTVAGSGS